MDVKKVTFEVFMSQLSQDREVGVVRSMLELMKKTNYDEILLFFSFWYFPYPSFLFVYVVCCGVLWCLVVLWYLC